MTRATGRGPMMAGWFGWLERGASNAEDAGSIPVVCPGAILRDSSVLLYVSKAFVLKALDTTVLNIETFFFYLP